VIPVTLPPDERLFEESFHGAAAYCRRAKRGPALPAVILFFLLMPLLLLLFGARSCAAAGPAVVSEIQVAPDALSPGVRPDIIANVKRASSGRTAELLQINIIAVLTRPDHITKSWHWEKITLAPGESRLFSVPKEYETGVAGIYKIEVVIYSDDMRRRLNGLSRTFTVSGRPRSFSGGTKLPAERQEPVSGSERFPGARERAAAGIGIYADALNRTEGATLLVWPFKRTGLQVNFMRGTFTSYEGRLLVTFRRSPGFHLYAGAGYLHVSKTCDVIGVRTSFTDSGVSGVLGIEIPVSKKTLGYLDVSAAKIDLKKVVTTGYRTVSATVGYEPVTIGAGLIFQLF
jgi:hypothetical protein